MLQFMETIQNGKNGENVMDLVTQVFKNVLDSVPIHPLTLEDTPVWTSMVLTMKHNHVSVNKYSCGENMTA